MHWHNFTKLFPALLLLLLSIGCTQNYSEADRILCLEITSYSQTSIPECATQEKCFSLVEQKLGMQSENMSSDVQSALHLYKNHLARSWLHYNRAMSNLKNINSICKSSESFSGITAQLNELKSNLSIAFEEADSTNKQSFSILLLEKAALEAQDINAIREEPLFDDYILINTNINELNSQSRVQNSDSYVSIYRARMAEFSDAAASLGIRGQIFSTYSLLDLIDSAQAPLLARVPNISFAVPLLSNALSSFFSASAENYKLHESVSALGSFHAFEILNTYNGIAGAENSVALKFSELITSDSAHRTALSERNSALAQEADTLLSSIASDISALDSSSYASFDQNFIAELYALLGRGSEISAQKYSITDISAINAASTSELSRLRSELQILQERKFLRQLSLGEETEKLKRINREARLLSENLGFFSTEIISGLEAICNLRVQEINRELSSGQISPQETPQAADLRAKLEYKLRQYSSAQGANSKLPLCRPIIELHISYSLSLSDFEQYERGTSEEIGACLNYLSSVFASPKANSAESYLPVFKKLIAIEKPYQNPATILSSCKTLRANIESILARNPPVIEISENYSAMLSALNYLRLMHSSNPEFLGAEVLNSAEKKLSEFGRFFNSGAPDYSALLPKLESARFDSATLLTELEQLRISAMQKYLAQTAQMESIAESIPSPNVPYSSKLRIALQNPWGEINSPLAIELPVDAGPFPKLAYSTPNISRFSAESGRLTLYLSSLPAGQTVAIFDSNAVLATSSESTSVILADTERAVMQKSIEINAKTKIPRLRLAFPLGEFGNVIEESISVYAGGGQIPHSIANGELYFYMPAEGHEKAEIYYSIRNPLQVSTELLSSGNPDTNTAIYRYSIKIRNALTLGLNSTGIIIPLPINVNSISRAELYTSSGKALKLDLLPGGIAFTLPELPPNQEISLDLELEVKDYSNYWQSALAGYESALSSHLSSAQPEISNSAQSLLTELSSISANLDPENESYLNSIIAFGIKVNSLSAAAETSELQDARYAVLLTELADAQSAVEQGAVQMRGFGFGTHAQELLRALQESKAMLANAEQLHSEGDADSAISELINAKAALSGVTVPGLWESVEIKQAELQAQVSTLFDAARKYGFDDSEFRGQIGTHEQQVSRALSFGDTVSARTALAALETSVQDYNAALSNSLKESCSEFAENIKLFSQISAGIPPKISSLRKMLADHADAQGLMYIFPITEQRLRELETELAGLNTKKLADGIAKFSEAFSQNDFLSAWGYAENVRAELGSALGIAELIDMELSENAARVKEDATVAFNSAVKQFNGSAPNDESASLLTRAKSELAGKNYMESIALSSRATALLSMPAVPFEGFEIPVTIYPLIAIVLLVLFFRFRSARNSKKKPALKKLERNG